MTTSKILIQCRLVANTAMATSSDTNAVLIQDVKKLKVRENLLARHFSVLQLERQ